MGFSGWKFALIAAFAVLLAGCSSHEGRRAHHGFASAATDPFAGQGSPYFHGAAIPFGGGDYTVGQPYRVAGRWYTPQEQPGYDKVGVASWYGEAFHRRRTSNGEWFDMNTLTAAHATLPLPSYVMVTNLENGRNVIVRVNDRGPFVASRIIDLSKRAADVLGYRMKGSTKVRVRLIGPAPTDDSMGHMLAMNQALSNGASMNQIVAMSGNTRLKVQDTGSALAQADPPAVAPAAAPQPRLLPASFAKPQAAPAQDYIVRVGVFHDPALASEAWQRVQADGPANIVRAAGANGPLYRVELGPYHSEADAEAGMTAAIGEGFENAKLLPLEPSQISMR